MPTTTVHIDPATAQRLRLVSRASGEPQREIARRAFAAELDRMEEVGGPEFASVVKLLTDLDEGRR